MELETARRIINGIHRARDMAAVEGWNFDLDYNHGATAALRTVVAEVFDLPLDEYGDLVDDLVDGKEVNEDSLRWIASGV